jgi:hypothetical protein
MRAKNLFKTGRMMIRRLKSYGILYDVPLLAIPVVSIIHIMQGEMAMLVQEWIQIIYTIFFIGVVLFMIWFVSKVRGKGD